MSGSSARDVCEFAVEWERRGEAFFQALAQAANDKGVTIVCKDLATEEQDHTRTFEQMRGGAGQEKGSLAIAWDTIPFARMLADQAFLPDVQQDIDALAKQDVGSLLELVIRFEKDSVLLFGELARAVDERDREAVRRIVDEEKLHVARLIRVKHALGLR